MTQNVWHYSSSWDTVLTLASTVTLTGMSAVTAGGFSDTDRTKEDPADEVKQQHQSR